VLVTSHDPGTGTRSIRIPSERGRTVTPLNADTLFQMVQQNDEKAEEGHARLRHDIRALESESARQLALIVDVQNSVKTLANRQPDLSNVLVPGKMLFGAIVCSATIVGAMWAITYGLRSDVRDLITTQEAHTKLEDERYINLKQMQEMQRVQTESLKTTVLTQQLERRRER
jgi:hypothetical protein